MDEAQRKDLFEAVQFALRKLDPWPPKGASKPSHEWARKVVEHLELAGYEFTRRPPVQPHSTPPDPTTPK